MRAADHVRRHGQPSMSQGVPARVLAPISSPVGAELAVPERCAPRIVQRERGAHRLRVVLPVSLVRSWRARSSEQT